jgi:exopolysaccharide production protein ExoZ
VNHTSSTYLVSIQGLRALAALLVLTGHLWLTFNALGAPKAVPNFIAGAAGVDLFFVISGFVMVYSSERFFAKSGGSIKFAARRLARIVPLYWVATSLSMCFFLSRGTLADNDLSWKSIAASYFFIAYPRPSGLNLPVLAPGWTLNLEMLFYAVFAAAVVLPGRGAVASASLALLCIMIAAPMTCVAPIAYLGSPLLWEFIFGMIIGLSYREGLRVPFWASAGFVITGIVVYIISSPFLVVAASSLPRQFVWGTAASFIVAGAVLSSFELNQTFPTHILKLLGDASYALYLTHVLTLTAIRLVIGHFVDLLAHPWMWSIVMVAACQLVAVAVNLALEKPTTRALQKIIDGNFVRPSSGSEEATKVSAVSQRVDRRIRSGWR